MSRADCSSPSISIVIPAYNHARFLGRTLDSVQAQTFHDWECVVVDDGSVDETAQVAREFAERDERIRVVTIENRGESGARNAGYPLTDPTSEFVTFMDSDDIWLPHALQTLRARLLVDSEAVGAHGLAEMVDEAGVLVSDWSHSQFGRRRIGLEGRRLVEWPHDRPTTFAVLINGNVLFPPGLLLGRRSAYDRAGRFDERFTGGADWDMLIRLSRQGHLSFANDVILHYRRHGANMGAKETVPRQAWLVRCKGFHSPENSADQQRVARQGWRAYQRAMIRERFREGSECLKRGKVVAGIKCISRVPIHAFRQLRGYPRPKLVCASEPW